MLFVFAKFSEFKYRDNNHGHDFYETLSLINLFDKCLIRQLIADLLKIHIFNEVNTHKQFFFANTTRTVNHKVTDFLKKF